MTTYRFVDSDPIEVEIDGHAGFNAGNDIVCSACSILTYMLIDLDEAYEIQTGDGYARISITRTPRSEHVVEAVRHMFGLLSDRYPDNVRHAGETADK